MGVSDGLSLTVHDAMSRAMAIMGNKRICFILS